MIVLAAAILSLVGPWSKPSTKITSGRPPNTEQAASPPPTPLADEMRGTHLFKPDEIPLIQREVLSPDYLPQSEAQKKEELTRWAKMGGRPRGTAKGLRRRKERMP